MSAECNECGAELCGLDLHCEECQLRDENNELRRLLHAMPNVIITLQKVRDYLDQTSGEKEISSVGPLGLILRIDEALADIRHARITATLQEEKPSLNFREG